MSKIIIRNLEEPLTPSDSEGKKKKKEPVFPLPTSFLSSLYQAEAPVEPFKDVKGKDIPNEDVEKAIIESNGFVSVVARKLGVSTMWVRTRLKKVPYLGKLFEEFREANVDIAEESLMKKVMMGDTVATIFFLKTLGKNRGYVESSVNMRQRGSVKIRVVPAENGADKRGSRKIHGKKVQDGGSEGVGGNIVQFQPAADAK